MPDRTCKLQSLTSTAGTQGVIINRNNLLTTRVLGTCPDENTSRKTRLDNFLLLTSILTSGIWLKFWKHTQVQYLNAGAGDQSGQDVSASAQQHE
jgi:hypothetical protein